MTKSTTSLNYRSALIFLTSTMIGVGYLTLPAICKSVGLINGLLIIFLTGISSSYGSYLLLRAYRLHNTENYPDLVDKILGRKHFYFSNINLNLYVLFSTTMYIYFGNELVVEVFRKYGVFFEGLGNFFVKFFVFFVAFCLSFQSIQKIRWFGYVGNFFSLFTAIVLICEMPQYYSDGRYKEIEYFKFSPAILVALGACFFAFTNQFSIITIMKILRTENSHTNFSALLRSNYFPIFLYTFISFAGYISFGENTPDFILTRKPKDGDLDIFMSIGQLGITVANIVSICVRIQSNKDTFLAFFKQEEIVCIEHEDLSKEESGCDSYRSEFFKNDENRLLKKQSEQDERNKDDKIFSVNKTDDSSNLSKKEEDSIINKKEEKKIINLKEENFLNENLLGNPQNNNNSEIYENIKHSNDKRKYSKKLEYGVICIFGIIPFGFSLLIKKEIMVLISLLTSILCPYYIIVAPALMNLKISKQLKIGKNEVKFIWAFLVFFTILLIMAIGINFMVFFGFMDKLT